MLSLCANRYHLDILYCERVDLKQALGFSVYGVTISFSVVYLRFSRTNQGIFEDMADIIRLKVAALLTLQLYLRFYDDAGFIA